MWNLPMKPGPMRETGATGPSAVSVGLPRSIYVAPERVYRSEGGASVAHRGLAITPGAGVPGAPVNPSTGRNEATPASSRGASVPEESISDLQ